jgi:S-DNA-T family DNA segregation ATPase FtsK/SpoIIIE
MAQQQKIPRSQWSPPWVAAVATLGCVAIVLAARAHVLPISVWGLPFLAIAGAIAAWIVGLVQAAWARTHVYRIVTCLAAGAWATWAAVAGWTGGVWLALPCGLVLLTAMSYLCRTPAVEPVTEDPFEQTAVAPVVDRRPPRARKWELLLRKLANNDLIRVVDLVPWDNPADGERVHVRLPLGMTWKDIVDLTDKIAAALRLPPGCVVRVLDGAHQGEAVLDVMLRDCLAEPTAVIEDFSPASINDEFPILTTPRGEKMNICLRIMSMIVGGTTGSGKTTLLNRLILWLARCVDALIWVIDLNGGGVAAPWIEPWALGKASQPVVDWIADTEEEAAVMVAVDKAIMKDRKTSSEARRRKKAAKSNLLPVDRDMPAIVILVDEGGEVQQAIGIIGQLVAENIARIAQIGRAEGGRIVMSVLRGTSDLLSKALRVVCGIRLCLRMEEDDEYPHILGTNPGKTRLIHTGSAYLRRPTDRNAIFGRTDDMSPEEIERAAVACAKLRPEMPESGLRAAAKVRARHVLNGRDPAGFEDLMALPVMEDVEAGRAYTGRWDRYAPKLAEMRGEEVPEDDEPPAAPAKSAVAPGTPPAGSALAALQSAAGGRPAQTPQTPAPNPVEAGVAASRQPQVMHLSDDQVQAEFDAIAALPTYDPRPGTARRPEVKTTTREHIEAILTEAYPETLTSAQIGVALQERAASVSRQYRQDVLKQMREDGSVVQVSGAYTVRPK